MRIFFTSLLLGLCLVGATASTPVLAQTNLRDQINEQVDAGVQGAGLPEKKDPREIIEVVIKVMLSLIGSLFMILLILGGFKYLNAKGDDGEVQKGTDMIRAAVIGLIIVLSAYSITLFVASKFQKAVVTGGQIQRDAERIDSQRE